MSDVRIDLDELNQVYSKLETITAEFDNASGLADELAADIGAPFGETRLRDKAVDFEERWDNKREKLNESLKKVNEHVKGVIDGFEDWDGEAAIALTPSESA